MVAGAAEKSGIAQLRRGVAEYCVLAMLRGGERYAFELARDLAGADGLVAGEGTLYPLLSRMRQQRLVETTWKESPAGPPRRYYQLTEEGERSLADFTEKWNHFVETVDAILKGEA